MDTISFACLLINEDKYLEGQLLMETISFKYAFTQCHHFPENSIGLLFLLNLLGEFPSLILVRHFVMG